MEDNYKNNMVFGIHPVLELIRSQKEIEKVFIQGGTRSPEISEIANFCRRNGIPVQFVPIDAQKPPGRGGIHLPNRIPTARKSGADGL